MFCPNCGIEVPDDMAFCPECGTKIASGLGSSQKNKESKQSTPPTSNSKKKEKNNKEGNSSGIIVKAAIGLVSIGAIALLVLALTGQFDKDAEKLGEAPVLKGNDTVSAFKDTRSSEVSVSTDLMDYVDKSEDEIIDIFGFEKNESHAYPGDRSKSDEKLDYCFMFMCEDGKVSEITVYDKTYADYPNANIHGVYYNMDEAEADKILKEKGLTRISEYEDADGALRVGYYDSEYRSTSVVYTNGKVTFIGYSTADESELIKELLAANNSSDSEDVKTESPSIDSNVGSEENELQNDEPYIIYNVKVSASDGGVNLREYIGTENKILYEMIPNGTVLPIYDLGVSSKGRQWGYTLYKGIYGWIALSQTNYEDVASIYAGLDLAGYFEGTVLVGDVSGEYIGISFNMYTDIDPADSSCGQAIIDGWDGQTTMDVYLYATDIGTSINDYDVLLQGIYDGAVYFGLYYKNGNKYIDYFVPTDDGLLNVATLKMTRQYES